MFTGMFFYIGVAIWGDTRRHIRRLCAATCGARRESDERIQMGAIRLALDRQEPFVRSLAESTPEMASLDATLCRQERVAGPALSIRINENPERDQNSSCFV